MEGLGDLIDGYEFHYPQELNEETLGEVRNALGDHDIYCVATGLHLDPRFGKGGLVSPDKDTREEALRRTMAAIDFAGGLGAHFIIWPGIEGYNYPFQTPYKESLDLARRRDRAGRRAVPGAGHPAVSRAQEFRARHEDPYGEHRHDPSCDPQAASPGP